jgi:hypothetical protein
VGAKAVSFDLSEDCFFNKKSQKTASADDLERGKSIAVTKKKVNFLENEPTGGRKRLQRKAVKPGKLLATCGDGI